MTFGELILSLSSLPSGSTFLDHVKSIKKGSLGIPLSASADVERQEIDAVVNVSVPVISLNADVSQNEILANVSVQQIPVVNAEIIINEIQVEVDE